MLLNDSSPGRASILNLTGRASILNTTIGSGANDSFLSAGGGGTVQNPQGIFAPGVQRVRAAGAPRANKPAVLPRGGKIPLREVGALSHQSGFSFLDDIDVAAGAGNQDDERDRQSPLASQDYKA